MSLIHMVYNYNQMKGNIDKCHVMHKFAKQCACKYRYCTNGKQEIPKITGF